MRCFFVFHQSTFEDNPSGVGHNPSLIGPFQTLLILYSLLCRDESVRQFVYAIGFEWPAEWERDWSLPITAEEVFNALQAGTPHSAEWEERSDKEVATEDVAFNPLEVGESHPAAMEHAGYMKLCQYARNTSEVIESIEALGILDSAKRFGFKDRVANIQIWRLSLSSRDSAERFSRIQNQINEMIAEELPKIGLKDEVRRVQQDLEDSLNLLFEPAVA